MSQGYVWLWKKINYQRGLHNMDLPDHHYYDLHSQRHDGVHDQNEIRLKLPYGHDDQWSIQPPGHKGYSIQQQSKMLIRGRKKPQVCICLKI